MSQIDYNADAGSTSDSSGKRIIRHPFVLRLLYTIGFAVMAWLLLWFVFAVTLLQLVVTLISGQRNEQLAEFGTKLSWWMRDLVRFLTGATSDLPFPLGPFPTL
ncbi:MAG: DUF4389 domain-containing protein [Reyranellaceae bacterium]